MNDDFTVFEYLYRDAGNYKAWGSLLLSGYVSAEEEEALRGSLDSGAFFVAESVGIPSVNRELWKWSDGPTEDDHGFHEFHGFRQANSEDLAEAPWGSADELLARFAKMAD